MVEVTQARELATSLMGVERFDADGNFHPDYLAMLDKYRQAGVQQGLDMAAAYIQTEYPFDKRKLVPAIRKLGGDDA